VQGRFIDIVEGSVQELHEQLALLLDAPYGKQKYLPYMQVLMLGAKPSA
jgi:hypothetical protein